MSRHLAGTKIELSELIGSFRSNLTEVAQEVGSDRAPKIFLFHPKFRHLMG